jgi:hypothetical protein
VKFLRNILAKSGDDAERRWLPSHLFGGRVRTSTLALIMAFLVVWWLYDTYRPHELAHSDSPPPPQVVPPGFVPDPNYTWAPRTPVDELPPRRPAPRTLITTPPTASTTPPTTTNPSPTTTPPPPFTLPPLPCLLPPPFCPETTTSTASPSPLPPQQEPESSSSSLPPAS